MCRIKAIAFMKAQVSVANLINQLIIKKVNKDIYLNILTIHPIIKIIASANKAGPNIANKTTAEIKTFKKKGEPLSFRYRSCKYFINNIVYGNIIRVKEELFFFLFSRTIKN
jgi:hypothetical protein